MSLNGLIEYKIFGIDSYYSYYIMPDLSENHHFNNSSIENHVCQKTPSKCA